jgi:hypothetical protein
MRFGEHFCAADFYKRGICRGICVEIVLDFWFGAVGFLVTEAQRAGVLRETDFCSSVES